MIDQLLARSVGGDVALAALQEALVLLDQGVLGEPRGHRGVLDGLHLDGVRGAVALELGDDQTANGIDAEHVEPVTFAVAAGGPPAVELESHHKDLGTEDLRVGEHPLLQVRALPQACLGERDGNRRGRRRAGDGEEPFSHPHRFTRPPCNGCLGVPAGAALVPTSTACQLS